MTATVTPSEIRSPRNGRVPVLDSPPAPARAGARIPVTLSVGKIRPALLVANVRRGFRRWWLWTDRPLSLAATWRTTAVDVRRVPARSEGLRLAWLISNHTDRYLMLLLLLVAPTFLQGPLRYLTARPVRRWLFYLAFAAFAATFALGKG
ncbi:hypothetical protein GCM10011608_10240 [Micromonospora sonchi]|uniref:Uncharacterized protein n=1 Tax=Micromonospora sonchi TaxID=1763543 RepID=A0A917TLC7_9ACTN|nr:hypothetical protein [Micromonospora sonchi]GGM27432.1 hypothetical protein GCM10011608_10240 [Micromonospora sonchi]